MPKKYYNEEEKLLLKKKKAEYYQENKDKIKKARKHYYDNNKEEILIKQQDNYNIHKTTICDKAKAYRVKHKEKLKSSRIQYLRKNKEQVRISQFTYKKNRLKTDMLFKLKKNISSLIRESFKNNSVKKNSKTANILGCTYEEFKQHLEAKFESWMMWDNYGNPKDGILEPNKTWDIDHIIPISTAKTEEDVIRLNHYTNLQPLCSHFNRVVKKDNVL